MTTHETAIATVRIPAAALEAQAATILRAYGATPEEAAIQAEARLQGALRGHPGQGQGMSGLTRYCAMLRNGGIVPGAPFEVLVDTPAMALVDGHKGFGQVVARRAMDVAIDKARQAGVGLVGVRHSNHLGITAYHAMRAADQGMIGLCLTNAGPEMAPWGGITPTIGTNPWGIAAPTDLGFPLVLDMALSTSGKGMIRWAQREGRAVPTDWAYDREGRLTDDPAQALLGPLVPIGAFKGTGLSIMTDVLCGVLTGAAFGLRPYQDPADHDVGHMLIAIDIGHFLPYDDYLARMREFCAELKASALAPGFDEILLPGELEHRRTVERLANGIPVDLETVAMLRDLAAGGSAPFTLGPYLEEATA
ncbi:MAG TPA: Ldh family oxidoreductase [Thermomicrobiales bacterium]|jgi:LDH2 family malate/lactate/ureidoglycolate dehydrogenase|nr:Ldh family oxidoreductase [Thermomicrobiales bacterium]